MTLVVVSDGGHAGIEFRSVPRDPVHRLGALFRGGADHQRHEACGGEDRAELAGQTVPVDVRSDRLVVKVIFNDPGKLLLFLFPPLGVKAEYLCHFRHRAVVQDHIAVEVYGV